VVLDRFADRSLGLAQHARVGLGRVRPMAQRARDEKGVGPHVHGKAEASQALHTDAAGGPGEGDEMLAFARRKRRR